MPGKKKGAIISNEKLKKTQCNNQGLYYVSKGSLKGQCISCSHETHFKKRYCPTCGPNKETRTMNRCLKKQPDAKKVAANFKERSRQQAKYKKNKERISKIAHKQKLEKQKNEKEVDRKWTRNRRLGRLERVAQSLRYEESSSESDVEESVSSSSDSSDDEEYEEDLSEGERRNKKPNLKFVLYDSDEEEEEEEPNSVPERTKQDPLARRIGAHEATTPPQQKRTIVDVRNIVVPVEESSSESQNTEHAITANEKLRLQDLERKEDGSSKLQKTVAENIARQQLHEHVISQNLEEWKKIQQREKYDVRNSFRLKARDKKKGWSKKRGDEGFTSRYIEMKFAQFLMDQKPQKYFGGGKKLLSNGNSDVNPADYNRFKSDIDHVFKRELQFSCPGSQNLFVVEQKTVPNDVQSGNITGAVPNDLWIQKKEVLVSVDKQACPRVKIENCDSAPGCSSLSGLCEKTCDVSRNESELSLTPNQRFEANCMYAYQKFVNFMIHPETSIDRFLLVHRAGAGKTLSMVRIVDNYFFDDRPTLLLFPNNKVLTGFFETLLNFPNSYREYIRAHFKNPSFGMKDFGKNREELVSLLKSRDKEDIQGVETPVSPLFATTYHAAAKKSYIDKHLRGGFDNTIIIMDEIHNLFVPHKLVSNPRSIKILQNMANKRLFESKNSVIVGATATPFSENDPEEIKEKYKITSLTNLMRMMIGKKLWSSRHVQKNYDVGIVSYFQDLPVTIFPRVDPGEPSKRMPHLYQVPLRGKALLHYMQKMAYETSTCTKLGKKRMTGFEWIRHSTTEGLPILSKLNSKDDRDLVKAHFEKWIRRSQYAENVVPGIYYDGNDKAKENKKIDKKSPIGILRPECKKYEDFGCSQLQFLKSIKEDSPFFNSCYPKFSAILKSVFEQNEKKTLMLVGGRSGFLEFKNIMQSLPDDEFQEVVIGKETAAKVRYMTMRVPPEKFDGWLKKGTKQTKASRIDHIREYGDDEVNGTTGFKYAAYLEREYVAGIQSKFNDISNNRGDICNFLIIDSDQFSEGVDFKSVRRLVFANVPSDITRYEQQAGRALRSCAHQMQLPPEEWEVKIDMYVSSISPEITRYFDYSGFGKDKRRYTMRGDFETLSQISAKNIAQKIKSRAAEHGDDAFTNATFLMKNELSVDAGIYGRVFNMFKETYLGKTKETETENTVDLIIPKEENDYEAFFERPSVKDNRIRYYCREFERSGKIAVKFCECNGPEEQIDDRDKGVEAPYTYRCHFVRKRMLYQINCMIQKGVIVRKNTSGSKKMLKKISELKSKDFSPKDWRKISLVFVRFAIDLSSYGQITFKQDCTTSDIIEIAPPDHLETERIMKSLNQKVFDFESKTVYNVKQLLDLFYNDAAKHLLDGPFRSATLVIPVSDLAEHIYDAIYVGEGIKQEVYEYIDEKVNDLINLTRPGNDANNRITLNDIKINKEIQPNVRTYTDAPSLKKILSEVSNAVVLLSENSRSNVQDVWKSEPKFMNKNKFRYQWFSLYLTKDIKRFGPVAPKQGIQIKQNDDVIMVDVTKEKSPPKVNKKNKSPPRTVNNEKSQILLRKALSSNPWMTQQEAESTLKEATNISESVMKELGVTPRIMHVSDSAVVFRITNRSTNRAEILKVAFTKVEGAHRKIKREIHVLQAFEKQIQNQHHHIPKLTDHDKTNQTWYKAMYYRPSIRLPEFWKIVRTSTMLNDVKLKFLTVIVEQCLATIKAFHEAALDEGPFVLREITPEMFWVQCLEVDCIDSPAVFDFFDSTNAASIRDRVQGWVSNFKEKKAEPNLSIWIQDFGEVAHNREGNLASLKRTDFSSIRDGKEVPSLRDDLESFGYVLHYLMNQGKKRSLWYDDDHLASKTKFLKRVISDKNEVLHEYFKYVFSLGERDVPDYQHLMSMCCGRKI